MKEIYFVARELVTLPKVRLSELRITDKGLNVNVTIDNVDGSMFVAKDYIGFKPNSPEIVPETAKKSTK